MSSTATNKATSLYWLVLRSCFPPSSASCLIVPGQVSGEARVVTWSLCDSSS